MKCQEVAVTVVEKVAGVVGRLNGFVGGCKRACVSVIACNVLCIKPWRVGVEEYGCGRCLPCKIKRRNLWTGRLLLERMDHAASWFVTLTYADEWLPKDLSVRPRELSKFLKRLRRRVQPERVRYYGVGEYGEDYGRPHYHLALYGLPALRHVNPGDAHMMAITCKCDVCKAWPYGGVSIWPLDEKTAAYICKYVTKFGGEDAEKKIGTRHREFARMSLRPAGIGATGAKAVFHSVARNLGWDYYLGNGSGDVPSVLRVAGKLRPLGRYLRSKIRQQVGLGTGEPPAVGRRRKEELQRDLQEEGARVRREERRVSDVHRAVVLEEISTTKGKRYEKK